MIFKAIRYLYGEYNLELLYIFGRIIYSLFSNNIFEVKEIKIGKKT